MPPVSVLIKPSSGMCNISCRYCFYHDITEKRIQASYGFMSEATLENVIKKTLEFADKECSIGFQGGEPTLIGLDFFKKVVELQNQYNVNHVTIHNAIQTNGYRLDEEWAKFLSQNNFLTGLSIDGTIHTHDAYRLTEGGKTTFADIMRTAELFTKHKVEFNILTVLNRRTALAIKKIYRFYQKNNFQYLQFIPCLDPIHEEPGRQEYSLTPELYGQALCELFDLWYDDIRSGKPIYIRQFENYVSMLHGYPAESCDMNGFCSLQNIIESDGSVYPCDFYVLDDYRLGNLNECGFIEIGEKFREIRFQEESIITCDACQKCPWYRLCRGGCKRHRSMAGSADYQYNYFCPSFQMFFAHSADRLMELAQMTRRA